MADNDQQTLGAPAPNPDAPTSPDVTPAAQAPGVVVLNDEEKAFFRDLKKGFEEANRQARWEEVRSIQRRHEFMKGNQNIFWNAQDRRWLPVTANGASTGVGVTEEDQRYDYVTNIYGPNCLIDSAILTSNPPQYQFGPKDPRDEADIATAKAAESVAEFISDNNRLDLKQIDLSFLMYNDGGCASFTRYETDANKYGTTPQPVMAPMPAKVGPDTLKCAQCGWQQDLPDGWEQNIEAVPRQCPQCGSLLGPENVAPGPMGMLPKVVAMNQIPNGMEVISYISYLELERPFYAKSQDEFPWIKWETEVPKGKLRALFPEVADQIATSGTDQNASGARSARISLAATAYGRNMMEGTSSLVTFSRWWFRPWSFYESENTALAKSLTQKFPDGAYIAFASEVVCEARVENMDDMWQVMHAMPGDGQIRPCIGEWMIDVQRRFNTEENIKTEIFERNISIRLMDTDVVDIDAYQANGALPGMTMGVQARPGQSIADSVYDTPAPNPGQSMDEHSDKLIGQYSQFITSNQPEVFGGDTGSNDTASGIKTIKDSAMGVKALFKIPMNEFHAKTMMNAIKCLQKFRKQDIVIAIEGADGECDSEVISLDKIKGNIVVRTDVNSAYPMSLASRRETLSGMLGNPAFQPILFTPQNMEDIKLTLGMPDIQMPNEDARQRQRRALRMMGKGIAVPINPLLDDHATCVAMNKEWWQSDEGQKAVTSGNQQVIDLVMQNTMEHLQATMAQQGPPPGAVPAPPPGAGPDASAPPPGPPVQ